MVAQDCQLESTTSCADFRKPGIARARNLKCSCSKGCRLMQLGDTLLQRTDSAMLILLHLVIAFGFGVQGFFGTACFLL